EVLIRNHFEVDARPAALVKGVEEPITHYRVVAERVPTPKSGRGPLVGRDQGLAQLEKSWVRAQAGTLSTPGVVFRGEPGIGKSRLAAAAAQLVEASASVVLELVGFAVSHRRRPAPGPRIVRASLWHRSQHRSGRATAAAGRRSSR